MLQDALRLMAEGGVRSLAELAERLEVSQDLALQMLEDLKRGGYLKADLMGCTGACEGCPAAHTCSLTAQARLWTVTPKGLALLRVRP
ncbi:MAG: FeoC-like transcriptional regulator [Anaerolineae bacterium]